MYASTKTHPCCLVNIINVKINPSQIMMTECDLPPGKPTVAHFAVPILIWPKNAIKRAFMALSGSGGSKWLDLSGSWLDLGGIHPGWFVGAIWTHQNCPWGLQGGQKRPKNAIKQAFMAISGSGVSKWLDLSGTWLDLGGIHPGWFVRAIWTHQNCPRNLQGVRNGPKIP